MQVFLPYPSFAQSTARLDPKRLGNQVYRECKTLISGGWPNHPCAKMWSEYKPALAVYCLCGLAELSRRGKDYTKHCDFFKTFLKPQIDMPPWLGNEKLHESHQAKAARLQKMFPEFQFIHEVHELISKTSAEDIFNKKK